MFCCRNEKVLKYQKQTTGWWACQVCRCLSRLVWFYKFPELQRNSAVLILQSFDCRWLNAKYPSGSKYQQRDGSMNGLQCTVNSEYLALFSVAMERLRITKNVSSSVCDLSPYIRNPFYQERIKRSGKHYISMSHRRQRPTSCVMLRM